MSVSVVVPSYRGSRRLGALASRLMPVVRSLAGEVVLVDDGSDDDTWEVMTAIAEREGAVTCVRMARRSGQQAATLAGCRIARGRWIVTLDDDLEHAPEGIPLLLARARSGCDLVYAVAPGRALGAVRRLGSRLFDVAFSLAVGKPFGLRLTGFRVMSRDLVARMLEERAAAIYVSALALRQRPRTASVRVAAGPRAASRYSLARLARVFAATLAAYSPLGRLAPARPVGEQLAIAEVRRAGV